MATPANLTENDLIKIGKDRIAKLLAIPEESRNSVICHVKNMIAHEAYNNPKYVYLYLGSVCNNVLDFLKL